MPTVSMTSVCDDVMVGSRCDVDRSARSLLGFVTSSNSIPWLCDLGDNELTAGGVGVASERRHLADSGRTTVRHRDVTAGNTCSYTQSVESWWRQDFSEFEEINCAASETEKSSVGADGQMSFSQTQRYKHRELLTETQNTCQQSTSPQCKQHVNTLSTQHTCHCQQFTSELQASTTCSLRNLNNRCLCNENFPSRHNSLPCLPPGDSSSSGQRVAVELEDSSLLCEDDTCSELDSLCSGTTTTTPSDVTSRGAVDINKQPVAPVQRAMVTHYVRTVIVLGLSLMLSQCPVYTLRNLQTSLHQQHHLGHFSLLTYHIVFLVSSLLTASGLSSRMRPKRVIVAALVGQLPWIVANGHTAPAILLPAAAISGFSAACLCEEQGTYLTSVGVAYAAVTHQLPERAIAIFTRFLFFMQQLSLLLGNLVTSSVYQFTADTCRTSPPHIVDVHNASWSRDSTETCPQYSLRIAVCVYVTLTSRDNTWLLTSLNYVTLTVIGLMVLILLLDQLDVIYNHAHRLPRDLLKTLSLALVGRVKGHSGRSLIAPLMTYVGVQEAFVYCDFAEFVVSRDLGLRLVGYTMTCFAACDVIASVVIDSHLHRHPRHVTAVLITGILLHTCTLPVVLLSDYLQLSKWQLFLLSAGLGVSDSCWQTTAQTYDEVTSFRGVSRDLLTCYTKRVYHTVGLCLYVALAAVLPRLYTCGLTLTLLAVWTHLNTATADGVV